MAHRIQNFDALAVSDLRNDALLIIEAGYAAVDVGNALARTLHIEGDSLKARDKTYALTGRIFFVGVGKCAFAAATALEELLGERLAAGIALDVSPHEGRTPAKIERLVGTHPLPSEVNEAATGRIMAFLSDRTAEDLVIMLVSGGGSALLCSHGVPMACTDESVLWSSLTARGATIQEINTVRKHTSRARGGGLADAAYPAHVLSLIVSDVPGNGIEHIASGPTVLDTSTVADAQAILAKYGIENANLALFETPKDPARFERVTNILFLSNQDALTAMQKEAQARGYATDIITDRYAGQARTIGSAIAKTLHAAPTKTALLCAGESTVTLPADAGAGGRNQEMALAALASIGDDELVLPFSSDGRDNTDYAGAIADAVTLAHAKAQNASPEDYLAAHRSYDFFTATGDALLTGYTGTNVSDLIVALKK
jgi:glycerate-2-kinase